MPVTWFDGVTVTARIALASPGGPYAQWDDPTAGWDVGQWGPDLVYQDVSTWLRRWSSSRAFRADGLWGGGTGSLRLDNADGRWDPDNPDSPYRLGGVSSLQPWRPAQVQVTYAGVTYDILTMLTRPFADEARTAPVPLAGGVDTTVVDLVDEWARLAKSPTIAVDPPEGAGELFGPRLHRILDAAGHRGPRDIESGTATLQATALGADPTRDIEATVTAEGGWCWPDASGTIAARARQSLVVATRSTSVQAIFTDDPDPGDPTQVGYRSSRTTPGMSDLYTEARYIRTGGVEQVYVDSAARALHGQLTAKKTGLINDNDADVYDLAVWRIAMDGVATAKPSEVKVKARSYGCAWLATYLSLREWDLVRYVEHKRSGYVLDRPCHITGISHDMDADGNWDITFRLVDASVPLQYAGSLWDVGQWASSPSDRTPGVCMWFPD